MKRTDFLDLARSDWHIQSNPKDNVRAIILNYLLYTGNESLIDLSPVAETLSSGVSSLEDFCSVLKQVGIESIPVKLPIEALSRAPQFSFILFRHDLIDELVLLYISVVPVNNTYIVRVELPWQLETTYGKNLEYKYLMNGAAEIITDELSVLDRLFLKFRSLVDASSANSD